MANQTGAQNYGNVIAAPDNGDPVVAPDVEVVAKAAADNTHSLLCLLNGVQAPIGAYTVPASSGFNATRGPTVYSLEVLNALEVGGQTTLNTLVVTGINATFQQAVSIQGALDVDGAVQGLSFDLEPAVQFERHMPFGPVFDPAFWSLDIPNGVIDNNVGGTVYSGERFVVPLRLPHGATLLGFQIDAAVPAAGALPAAGDRVKAGIYRMGQGTAKAGVLGPYSSGAADLASYQAKHQIGIAPGGPSVTINAEDYTYWVEITADNYAPAQRTDIYFCLKVWFEATAVRPGGM